LPRIAAKLTNERREQVWKLMLMGHNPQSIIKTLGSTQTVIYNDIKFINEKGKRYVFDIAKGDVLALQYMKCLDGLNGIISECWRELNDPKTPNKQRPAYYRLIKDCHESMTQQVTNGAAVLAVNDLRKRIEDMGINVNIDNFNLDRDKYDSAHNTIN